MKSDTPTPRTHAHFVARLAEGGRTDKRDEKFARQLEKELAVALEALLEIAAPTWGEGKHPTMAENALGRIMAMRREFEEGK